MKEQEESFDILNLKGIHSDVQKIFSKVIKTDSLGRIYFPYTADGHMVNEVEIVTLLKLKMPSKGISILNIGNSDLISTLYFSDSMINLICFVNKYYSTKSFVNSAFVSIGAASFKKSHLHSVLNQYPHTQKIAAIFSNSITGRVKDCLLQHWYIGQDCSFSFCSKYISARTENKCASYLLQDFSLNKHINTFHIRRKRIRTYKPNKNKLTDFYNENKFHYELSNM